MVEAKVIEGQNRARERFVSSVFTRGGAGIYLLILTKLVDD